VAAFGAAPAWPFRCGAGPLLEGSRGSPCIQVTSLVDRCDPGLCHFASVIMACLPCDLLLPAAAAGPPLCPHGRPPPAAQLRDAVRPCPAAGIVHNRYCPQSSEAGEETLGLPGQKCCSSNENGTRMQTRSLPAYSAHNVLCPAALLLLRDAAPATINTAGQTLRRHAASLHWRHHRPGRWHRAC